MLGKRNYNFGPEWRFNGISMTVCAAVPWRFACGFAPRLH